ncbi:MAG: tetratricopeptide repeat protein [Planctomycetota bacterium]
MASFAWMKQLYQLSVFAVVLSLASFAFAQDEGGEDLEMAFQKKAEATTLRDLDDVAELCESAIEKGLSPEDLAGAEELLTATLYEHADQLGQLVFQTDRRWRKYRRDSLLRLDRVIELSPDMTEAWLLIARLQTLDGGDTAVAEEALDKVLELAGEDTKQKSEALLSRATLAAVQNDEEALVKYLSEAIEIDPENTRAMQIRGEYYLRKGEPEKAVEDFKLWLNADPDNLDAYFKVATSMAELEMYDEAVEIVDEAIKVKPDEIRTHIARAGLNMDREEFEEAIQDATNALGLDRRSREGLIIRSEAYLYNGDYEEAIEDVEEMLEEEPGLIAAIEMRGRIRAAQGDFAASIEDYKLLAENRPDQIGYSLQLAQLYNADDRPRQAIRIYNRVLRLLPDEETFDPIRQAIHRGRGDARLSTGEHGKAIEEYESAMEYDDEDAKDDGVLNNLAWVLATSTVDELRDGQRAIELATEACEETDYSEPHILSTLASGYAEIGDFDEAIKWIEEGMRVNDERREEEVNGENDAEELERIEDQHESLQDELDSYLEKKPWREMQNVEEERRQAEAEEEGDSDDGTGSSEGDDDSGGDEESGDEESGDSAGDEESGDGSDAEDGDGDEDGDADQSESEEAENEEEGGGGVI